MQPEPASIFLSEDTSSGCGSCCLGRTEKKPHLFLLLLQEPTLPPPFFHLAGSTFRFPGAGIHQEVPGPAETMAGEGVCPHGAAKGPGAGAQRTCAAAEGTGHLAPPHICLLAPCLLYEEWYLFSKDLLEVIMCLEDSLEQRQSSTCSHGAFILEQRDTIRKQMIVSCQVIYMCFKE